VKPILSVDMRRMGKGGEEVCAEVLLRMGEVETKELLELRANLSGYVARGLGRDQTRGHT
jgi:hypothetical protein